MLKGVFVCFTSTWQMLISRKRKESFYFLPLAPVCAALRNYSSDVRESSSIQLHVNSYRLYVCFDFTMIEAANI